MLHINFAKTNWHIISDQRDGYLMELGGKSDGFHNSMIFEADPYTAELDGELIGFFSLMDGWDGGKMLTSFYLTKVNRRYSTEILDHIIWKFHVTAALVASNDCHFVAIAFEKMHALGTTFEMQAYNHIYGKPKRQAEFGRNMIFEVNPEEYNIMNTLTEKQWDGCYGNPHYSFFAIRENGKTLGYGAIGRLHYDEKRVDIGNYTLSQHRRKGVGRSILINLAEIAIEQGLTPVAGCWVKNMESIPTLASSGFIPENRLFYVKFI